MQYQEYGSPFPILRLNPRRWINGPSDPAYADFQAWIAAGNTPISGAAAAPLPSVEQLALSDYSMARIGEDVLNVLIAKGIMQLTDLPAVVQQRITNRQALRAQIPKE